MRALLRVVQENMQRAREWALYATFVPIGDTSANSPLIARAFGASDLPTLLNALFKTAIAIGAIIAVVRLVYAGFLYMTTDLPGSKGNARDIIWDTIIGLFLLLGVWMILNMINPEILNLNAVRNVTPLSR